MIEHILKPSLGHIRIEGFHFKAFSIVRSFFVCCAGTGNGPRQGWELVQERKKTKDLKNNNKKKNDKKIVLEEVVLSPSKRNLKVHSVDLVSQVCLTQFCCSC